MNHNYSAGLLPLLSHAAMTVKPTLLTLYETYVLPVCSAIKPAAVGVILGILPGLEEGSEYYDRWVFRAVLGAENLY